MASAKQQAETPTPERRAEPMPGSERFAEAHAKLMDLARMGVTGQTMNSAKKILEQHDLQEKTWLALDIAKGLSATTGIDQNLVATVQRDPEAMAWMTHQVNSAEYHANHGGTFSIQSTEAPARVQAMVEKAGFDWSKLPALFDLVIGIIRGIRQ